MRLPISGLSRLSKSMIQISGPDATKFLNGLVTSRLLPNVVKKKQHTISENENRHANLSEIIDIHKNWGLMHEDIYDPDNTIVIGRDGVNSMILNSKGRIVHDCFLYSNPFHGADTESEPQFLVEVASRVSSKMLLLLKIHKLSARINIDKQDLYSYYYYHDSAEFDQWLDMVQAQYFLAMDPAAALHNANSFIQDEVVFNGNIAPHILGFAFDNRIPNFGLKVITDKPLGPDGIPMEEAFSAGFRSIFPVQEVPEETVTRRRYANGVFETQDAPKDASLLPFETNLDYINGLSLDKGCYVGQELTIRTFNNGVIRKRVHPVQFFDLTDDNIARMSRQEALELQDDAKINALLEDIDVSKAAILPLKEPEAPATPAASLPFGSSPFGDKPVRQRKASSGKLLSVHDNLGFMLVNLGDLEESSVFKMEAGNTTVGVRVFKPDWWPEQ